MTAFKKFIILTIWSVVATIVILASIEYGRHFNLADGELGTLGIAVFVFCGGTFAGCMIMLNNPTYEI